MRRLLWKELREKRIWFILLPAICLVSELTGRGFAFVGNPPSLSSMFGGLFSYLTLGIIPPVPLALLMGFTIYSSELSGTIQFLYSRPASWKQILAAKLAVAVSVILISIGVSFAVYMHDLPQDYQKLANPCTLLIGGSRAFIMMAAACAIGASCSVLMPGLIGGMLTLLAVLMLAMVQAQFLSDAGVRDLFWTTLAWFIGAAVAAIVIIRFGLTLSSRSRTLRYAAIVAVVVVCIFPVDLLMPRADSSVQKMSISPDAKYMVTQIGWYGDWRLVRLKDGEQTRLKLNRAPDMYTIRWIGSETLILKGWGDVILVCIDTADRVTQNRVRVTGVGDNLGDVEPSPDGDLVAVSIPTGTQNFGEHRKHIEFVDVKRARKLDMKIKGADQFMWLSDRQIRYVDTWGHVHTVGIRI